MRADLALQHLLMANPGEAPADPLAEAAAWITRREEQGWFRVVDTGEGAMGFVQITDIHRKNRFGWLGIALSPGARGKGLGAVVLEVAEQAGATDLGLRKLLLQVRADNIAALRLYERGGWRKAGHLLAQYDDGAALHDVLILEKALA